MYLRTLATAATLFLAQMPALAQHAGGSEPSGGVRAPQEARQYEWMMGQWELEVTPQVSGLAARIHGAPKLGGTWKVWKGMEGWGVEDELRIVDASGNPRTLLHALRVYDRESKRWKHVAVDVYKGVVTQSTATWDGSAMVVAGQGTDGEGKAYISRGRFSEITPTSFKYRLDRSYDQGKSWTDGVITIVAKRSAATAPR